MLESIIISYNDIIVVITSQYNSSYWRKILTLMTSAAHSHSMTFQINTHTTNRRNSASKSTAMTCIRPRWFILMHVAAQPGKSWTEFKKFKTHTHVSIFSVVRVTSRGQVSFYGLIQQQHLRLGFWASQGHSWWNYWDSTPFITAWHVSCSRFWCRKVTAEDSSFFVEQPSKTTSCIYQKKKKGKKERSGVGGLTRG